MSKPNDPPPVIDWAIEHARAALRVGVSVPEIERRLVARGLDPMIAEAAVTHALSDRIREKTESYESEFSKVTYRITAALIGGVCALLAFRTGGMWPVRIFLLVMLILGCVWLAQVVGARENIPVRLLMLIRWLGRLVVLLWFVYQLILLSYIR